MEFFRTKPENLIVIVDEEEFDRIDRIAKLKEEEVEKLAEEKFLRYVKDNGIDICLHIKGVKDVIWHKRLIDELNYDERGYPQSVDEEVKYAIVDDISYYVEKHFEHYVDDCKQVVWTELDKRNSKSYRRIKFWKYLFLITLFLLLVDCIFRLI